MKHVGNYFSKSAVYGVALVITSLVVSVQAQPKQGQAVVRAIVGSADYSADGQTWKKLTVNRILKSGTVIKTAAMSHVDLFLRQNGPVVRVTADTMLGLDSLLFEDTGTDMVIETRLDLRNGRIQGNVKKLAAASKYEVKIPTGTVGIRGTDYDISATGIASCLDGSFVMMMPTPTGPQLFTVNAGQTFMPASTPDQMPTVIPTPPGMAEPPPILLPPGPTAPPLVLVPPSIPPVAYVFGQVTLISSNVFNNFVFPPATEEYVTNIVSGIVTTNIIPAVTNIVWTDPVTHLMITNYFTNFTTIYVTNNVVVTTTNVIDQILPGQTGSPTIPPAP